MNLAKKYSFISFIVCVLMVTFVRFNYHQNNEINGYNATTWDALGYYIYLPATLIHQDISKLEWFDSLDKKYQLSGGEFYQATEISEDKHVFKYLGGVAILQTPFFLAAHVYANFTDYPTDGFSAPYQYAIIWGAVFWFLIGLWILKKCLNRFFSDLVTAIVLLLIVGASNLIQYVSVDGAMSHAFIFPLYSGLLWFTIKWHENFKLSYIFGIGLIIGLATISRPTELIMIFIPILWGVHTFQELKEKLGLIFKRYRQIILLFLGGIIGIFPQLIYWKLASGDWIYNVGSKWYFLNPWWRVLFGFEKGWFIYTPIALFMILGLFFIKGKVYQKSITVFIILNIWIIISWSDWRYGASYSTRALTHSYPVFAFALAGITNYLLTHKLKWFWGLIGFYLLTTNLFQIWQYNAGIIHYNDMNRKYYASIYWNPNPSALDYSLLDTDFRLTAKNKEELVFKEEVYFDSTNLKLSPYEYLTLFSFSTDEDKILKNKIIINAENGYNLGVIEVKSFKKDSTIKTQEFRLSLPFYSNHRSNIYENHYTIPAKSDSTIVRIKSFADMKINKIKATTTIGV